MARKTTLDDLRVLEGVRVAVAQEFPSFPFSSYRVEARNADGDVVYSTMLRCRDDGTVWDPEEQGTLDDLVDPAKHAARLNPPPLPEPGPKAVDVEQRIKNELDKLGANPTAKDVAKALRDALGP